MGGASAPPTVFLKHLFRSNLARMLELIGDSARGDDYALVRLRVRDGASSTPTRPASPRT